MTQQHFAVVGAGVVGLQTALELQRQLPDAKVTLLSDKFTVDTTSDVAAGLFRPSTSFTGPSAEITLQWIRDSYEMWKDILESAEAEEAGVRWVDVEFYSNTNAENVRNTYLENTLPAYNVLTDAGRYKYGAHYRSILTDCRRFLPWATGRFIAAGGTVLQQRVTDFRALNANATYTAVFNCAGLGARQLCSDAKTLPIRGQVLRVHAPWVRTVLYDDFDTYVMPTFDGIVVLGGTRNYDSYVAEPCRHESAAIVERCERLCPGVAQATVVREQVGLRPHRSAVRVECEWLVAGDDSSGEQKSLLVVHNYGHGGFGVTTSPGTARYAVQLVRKALRI